MAPVSTAEAIPWNCQCLVIGTGTGDPFGNYEYLSGLGYKVLGHVPFSIPLSWFYMGLASFMLGSVLARSHPVWSVVLVSGAMAIAVAIVRHNPRMTMFVHNGLMALVSGTARKVAWVSARAESRAHSAHRSGG